MYGVVEMGEKEVGEGLGDKMGKVEGWKCGVKISMGVGEIVKEEREKK